MRRALSMNFGCAEAAARVVRPRYWTRGCSRSAAARSRSGRNRAACTMTGLKPYSAFKRANDALGISCESRCSRRPQPGAAPRRRVARGDEGLARAEIEDGEIPIAACTSATSSRRRSDEEVDEHDRPACVREPSSIACSPASCTARALPSRPRRLLEHRSARYELFLPRRRAAQASARRLCSARSADVAGGVALDPLRAFLDDLLEHLAPLRRELRRAQPRAATAALVEAHLVALVTRAASALPRRAGRRAAAARAERARRLALLLRDLRSTCSSVASGSSARRSW